MKYFIANWKLNMNKAEVLSWLKEFKGDSAIIAPAYPYLPLIKESKFAACAQDVSLEEKGAHTGEVGAFQLKDYCKYCIVGHSERKESLQIVQQKRDRCLENGITPIVCFVNIEDAEELYKPVCLMAWEDPANISKNGVYNAKNPAEVRTNIQLLKARLPEKAEIIYGGSVNRQNIKELANIRGLDGVLVGNASLDPEHFYEICRC